MNTLVFKYKIKINKTMMMMIGLKLQAKRKPSSIIYPNQMKIIKNQKDHHLWLINANKIIVNKINPILIKIIKEIKEEMLQEREEEILLQKNMTIKIEIMKDLKMIEIITNWMHTENNNSISNPKLLIKIYFNPNTYMFQNT